MALSRVISALERLAPTRHAAKWDNVGLLVDHVQLHDGLRKLVVFFTNDLTPAVLDEAVQRRADMIITYHPTPFAGLKKFEMGNIASKVVLTCAHRNIAVYSPHTSWDVAPIGLNEWLINGIVSRLPQGPAGPMRLAALRPVKRSDDPMAAEQGYGDGRIGELPQAVTVADVMKAVKRHLGLGRVQIALPTSHQAAVAAARRGGEADGAMLAVAGTLPATSIAVCAGSGSGVLAGVRASVLVTGEMGHHEVLAACHAGCAVILTGHSNCERGYLPVFADRLKAALMEPLEGVQPLEIETLVSQTDCDPLYSV